MIHFTDWYKKEVFQLWNNSLHTKSYRGDQTGEPRDGRETQYTG